MNFRQNSVVLIATGAYIGYIPLAPGTFGSLWGLLLCYGFSFLPYEITFVFLAGLAFMAVWTADQAQKIFQQKDPGCIVIDEVLGLVVGIFGLPFNLYTAVAGFVVFRMFDIFKPFPINWLDKKISGGLGIVIDDVAAGVFTNVIVRLGMLFFA